MTELNSLLAPDSGWDLSWAVDINDRGQITGYGIKDGQFRAYLMTPVARRRLTQEAGLNSRKFQAGAKR